MKKVLSIILIAVFFFCSCEDVNKEHIKTAYNYLCDASVELENISDIIQTAWHYGIYNTTDSIEDNVRGLESKTGISAKELLSGAFRAVMLEEIDNQEFKTPAVCVYACIRAMGDSFESVSESINKAKDEIQIINSNNNDYESIKKYYSDALTFYEWLKKPDGNYNQAIDTINDYNNKLKEHKNDLKLDYGD